MFEGGGMTYQFPMPKHEIFGGITTDVFLQSEINDKLLEWLENNTPEYKFVERQGIIVALEFEKEKDAMLFKLAWETRK